MSSSSASDTNSARTVLWILAGVAVLFVVLIALRRRDYPDGTLLHPERTIVTENLNPDLEAVMKAVVIGETPVTFLQERLGEPAAKLERDGLEMWAYRSFKRVANERTLLGLVPTGESTSSEEWLKPVGVKDGIVVHTTDHRSPDRAISSAVRELWNEYLESR